MGIGIGDTTPRTRLDVANSSNSTASAFFENTFNGNNTNVVAIRTDETLLLQITIL